MDEALRYHFKTLYLFTRSDYKTIFFPLAFATASAVHFRPVLLLRTIVWIWLHLLQANVSNQTFSGHEDKVNKPWRPLPSGRITVATARRFRWWLMLSCLVLSALQGPWALFASGALTVVEILHDDLGLSGHLIFKTSLGASICMSSQGVLDRTVLNALVCSGAVIFTTISAQDFADVEGDNLSGRRTLPIVAPLASRYYMLVVILLWTRMLTTLWRLGPISSTMFLLLGVSVATRFLLFHDRRAQKMNYLLYNVSPAAWLEY
ncbi:UbiA prenyltransferase family [Mucidula mucida]|nr:UbiA prenyltransferase family [Mucidula mucida]